MTEPLRSRPEHSEIAEKLERIIKRVETGGKWEPQPESAGHLRGWLLDSLKTLALACRAPAPPEAP
jgi:hypothetical protein